MPGTTSALRPRAKVGSPPLRDGLLVRFPDMPDGWEYLGLVHEKRDERHAAAGASPSE
jgi:hypothetical protein